MATITLSLPAALEAWVEAQAGGGRYADASDYVRYLIRRDHVRAEKIANMQKLVDEARAEPAIEMTMDEILREVRERAAERLHSAA